MAEKIKSFLSSDYFIYAMGLIAFVIWLAGWEVAGIFIFAVTGALLIAFFKNTRPFLSLACFAPFILSRRQIGANNFDSWQGVNSTLRIVVFAIGAALLVAAFVFHFVRYGMPRLRKGFALSFVLVMAVAVLAGAFSSQYSLGDNLWNFASYFWLAALCLAFAGWEGEDFKDFACKLIMTAGFVILAQFVTYFIRADDALAAMQNKWLDLGWAVGNSLSPIMNIAVACMLYMFCKKDNVLYMIFAALFALVTVLTLSRGNIVALVIGLPFMAAAVFLKCKNKKKAIISVAAILGVLAAAALLKTDLLQEVFSKMFEKGTFNEDRRLLWGGYVDMLKNDPVFGVGFYGKNGMYMPHSALLNVAACMGFAGLLAFAFHYFEKYKPLFCYHSAYQLFALIGCAMAAGYALIDMSTFNIAQQMMIFLVLEAAARGKEVCAPAKAAQKASAFAAKYAPWLLAAGVALWIGGTAWLLCAPYLDETSQWVLREIDYAVVLVIYIAATVLTFLPLQKLKEWKAQLRQKKAEKQNV